MKAPPAQLRRTTLPLGVSAAVIAVHFVWLGLFPERDPAQDGWATVPALHEPSWLQRYVEAGSYWMGYSYALSLSFAAVAVRWYRERRFCAAGRIALGGITLSGFLAAAGCFLLGCCGSPMLGVYLSLFGAAFLPLAKPLIATLTTGLILGSYLWMRERGKRSAVTDECEPCGCGGDRAQTLQARSCAGSPSQAG